MALKNIEKISLFTYFKRPSLDVGKPEFPVIAFIENGEVIAAIKVSMRQAWHVDNVTAKNNYGPTIYKVLMDLSGQKGIAPSFKYAKERKDFVVPKSRNIWARFCESKEVSTSFLADKYEDNVLNNRFVSVRAIDGINEAKRNLKNNIRIEYIRSISFGRKLASKIRPKKIDLGYRAFICNYHFSISRAAKKLLNASVQAHQ
ncbi:hypothetical protein [Paraglaciecola sp. 25GB23A]|uniref:hypothetical protein n=1 Tax=Paraglaciecola sp. 25GB23A TaxID=3156068 RepID=UPI0032AE9DC6